MSILSLARRSFTERADVPAVECDCSGVRRTFTFGEIDARSARLAQVLAGRGLVAGDRLAFYLANRVEIIDLWLACARLGVIVVPINVLYRGREIRHILGDSTPRAVVTSANVAAELPAGTTCWMVEGLDHEATHSAPWMAHEEWPDDTPAALVYTSGTTGPAKGAVLTHGNFTSNATALVEAWRITRDDRYLAVLPLFHVHGLGNGVHAWLATGCHMRLVERFERTTIVNEFNSYKPTLFFGVPTIYHRLLECDDISARRIGHHARLFVSGSAPLPAHVLEAFRGKFGHVILERYGMTETLMNTSNPYDGERRAGSVGPALPHVSVRVRMPDGDDLADGELGELWVQGPNVCDGYWQRPDATAAAFVDGWFRTGDIGVRARDGYVTLHGRRSDLIISGGFNIYPREIEELLLEQPGVREASVVGVPDEARGEVPVAYLVCEGPLNEVALRLAVSTGLASFKAPRAYVRVEALPRTALGKVQKHLLPSWTRS
jgi:malonyl-CoA/methylmalonyl-CoA synthetase